MKRITSFLLCFAMIFTLLPSIAMASGAGAAIYDEDGCETDYIELPQNGRVTLYAASDTGDFQWQIKVTDDVWVNISDETDDEITLSYAMVANLLDGDRAYIRCVGGEDVVSDEVVVEITDPVFEESEVFVYSTREASEAASAAEPGIEPAAEGDPHTYSVVINYVFANGVVAANPWTASVAEGSNLYKSVTSPTVVGYTPDQATVEVSIEKIQEDTTITVTYSPALVKYTVVHYQQNLNDDGYTVADRETKTGYTKDPVGEDLEKNYTGFYSLLYDAETEIAADGSTEIEIYYDRYYYLMTFDLDGGYGVEPIYARYGAPISVGTPTKAGYTFSGWSPALTYTTMPAQYTSYKATWTAGNTTYDVVFWYENADDTNYSQAGVLEDVSAAAGSVVEGSTYNNADFAGRDAAHFTYSHADTNVTVKGDGSTVVNVYFSRDKYTLTFRIRSIWNSYTTVKEITEKYEAKISHYFPIVGENGTTYKGYQWEDSEGDTYDYVLQTLDVMPGNNVTFNGSNRGTDCVIYYYVEVVTGESLTGLTTRTFDGKTYKLFKTVEHSFNYLTYGEEFHPIEGFSRSRSNAEPAFGNDNKADLGSSGNGYEHVNYLYYERMTYTLSFSNMGTKVAGEGGTVQYEAPLKSYEFTPDYPSNLEPDAYVFEGWYESDFFGDTKVDFETATMPAADVTLYANWVPKDHYVNIYLTSEMNEADKIGDTQVVPHRELATAPEQPTNGDYTFVGWFYMDGETEKAFDFSMPVTKDLDLYAKWSSNTLVEYTIKYVYVDENGVQIEIAKETTGSGLAGTTKTFEAKAGTDLNEGYQSGYFPMTNSHSLTLDLEDSTKNVYVFKYVKKDEVNYTVKYLELLSDGTTEPMKGTDGNDYPDKTASTTNAVITETFVPFTGYMPDAYSKRLVLSANEDENVIIFYYTKDDTHAPVQIIHYIQNAVGDDYTVYQESTDLNGVIDQSYSTDILTIEGFTFDHATANEETVIAEGGKVTGTVTANGLVLKLYYNRKLYPYEFKFLEQGTEKILSDSVTGTARYGAQVTQNAKSIAGYTLVSSDSQAIQIAIEDGDTAVKNVRTFYYTEQEVTINYTVVGPNGCGTLSLYSEAVKVITGTATGSTAAASSNVYRFVGWYDNKDCTGDPLSTEEAYVPTKPETGWVDGTTYYAKFEYNLTSLTITKTVYGTYYEGESFIFNVKGGDLASPITVVINGEGSVTIDGLTVGQTYTVTEDTSWSYRYTANDAEQQLTLVANPTENKNTAAFTNTKIENSQWLYSEAYCQNIFSGNTITPKKANETKD